MTVRIYTAEQPDGSVLWPEERPQEWLNKVKYRMPRAMFNAQYNNDPSGLRGVKYDVAWIQFYLPSQLPPLEELTGFQSGDPATSKKETSDYFGHCTAGRHRETGIIYILDIQFGHYAAPEHLKFLETQFILWKNRKLQIQTVRIETGGPQQATTQNLIAATRQSSVALMPIEEFKPKGSKEDRIDSMIPHLSNGTVLFPGTSLSDGNVTMIDRPGFQEFMKEFAQFPRGGRDDVLDAVFMNVDGLSIGTEPVVVSETSLTELMKRNDNDPVLKAKLKRIQMIQRIIEIQQELNSLPTENQEEVSDYRTRVIGRRSIY